MSSIVITLLTCLLLTAAAIYCILAVVFYVSLNDKSASAPRYAGRIIADPKQRKMSSTFDHASTASEVIKGKDLRGKVVVITGGHSGTGREEVKALTSVGARVICLARDVERARKKLAGINNVEIKYVDLLEPASIDAFASKVLASHLPIDILINSAAIMATPLQRDRRGYERQFATNVLGHYELTVKLVPALERANGARIINIASRGHRSGDVQFDDIHFAHTPYSGMRAYAQSKTALILLSIKEDELLKNKNIRAFAVHPGAVPSTDLFAAGAVGYGSRLKVWSGWFLAAVFRAAHLTETLNLLRRPANVGDIYKTVQQGAATAVWAATSHLLDGQGGLYLEDSNVALVVPDGSEAPFGVRPWALEQASADRIWSICEQMTGTRL